ncbi:hypothetical protein ACSW9O_15580 (plasmid) [Clostridium perfringens]|nr:hypothetical protein [Clostridium perfringens]
MEKFVSIRTSKSLPTWPGLLCQISNGKIMNTTKGDELYNISIEFNKAFDKIKDLYGESYKISTKKDYLGNIYIVIEDKIN